jgi:hypothetical protein
MRFSSTPFFSALGPLLFGRPPCSELKTLQAQAQGTDSISELRKALGQFVPDALFGQDKRGARQRLFTPLVTFWAFLSQVLSPESACRDAVRKAQAWWSLGRRRPISSARANGVSQQFLTYLHEGEANGDGWAAGALRRDNGGQVSRPVLLFCTALSIGSSFFLKGESALHFAKCRLVVSTAFGSRFQWGSYEPGAELLSGCREAVHLVAPLS